jgi:putative salt-induced outer membrane protein YdiY
VRGAVAFLTNEVDSVTRARSFTAEGRVGIQVDERLELFGEGDVARDRFAGIDGRATASAGVAYRLPLSRSHALTVEGGSGATFERRLDAVGLRFATATGALRYAWTIAPGTELVHDVDVRADIVTPRNWWTQSGTAVSVTLTRLLSFKASHAVEFRNVPVPGFRRLDMRTAAALVLSLQRRGGPVGPVSGGLQ